eukprot:1177922-Prorocentrum_minimum.AAC.1
MSMLGGFQDGLQHELRAMLSGLSGVPRSRLEVARVKAVDRKHLRDTIRGKQHETPPASNEAIHRCHLLWIYVAYKMLITYLFHRSSAHKVDGTRDDVVIVDAKVIAKPHNDAPFLGWKVAPTRPATPPFGAKSALLVTHVPDRKKAGLNWQANLLDASVLSYGIAKVPASPSLYAPSRVRPRRKSCAVEH